LTTKLEIPNLYDWQNYMHGQDIYFTFTFWNC